MRRGLGALVVDLQGGVVDVVLRMEQLLDRTPYSVTVRIGRHQYVGRQCRLAGGDLPDVEIVHLGHRVYRRELGSDGAGSRPTGAASKKIRPDSRTRPQPALSISAATTSAAMASARVKPVSHTTAPATAVAMKA